MKTIEVVLAAALSCLLVACGGGGGGGTAAGDADVFSRPHPVAAGSGPLADMALPAPRLAAVRTPDAISFLNWAESAYPNYFPPAQSNKYLDVWTYRYYPKTDIYLGTNTSGEVLGLVGKGAGNYDSVPLGKVADFGCSVYPSECVPVPTSNPGNQAPFSKGDYSMAMIAYGNRPQGVWIKNETQESDGSFKKIGSYESPGVTDIISTKHFAMGVLDSAAGTYVPFHYVTYNHISDLSDYPPRDFVCDKGVFNSPTSSHGSNLKKGSATGSATLSVIDMKEAKVGLTINVTGANGAASGTLQALTYQGDRRPIGFNGQKGSLIDPKISQATVAIGDAGNAGDDGYIVAIHYMMDIGNESYVGVAAFTCK